MDEIGSLENRLVNLPFYVHMKVRVIIFDVKSISKIYLALHYGIDYRVSSLPSLFHENYLLVFIVYS